MRRKLIKQAGQALTITLPIGWIRQNNLKQGDEIDIESIEKNLVLKSDKKIVSGTIRLDTTGLPKRIKYTYTNAAYARGIDEIKMETDKGFYPDLNQNLGFAVISQKENKFTIKDISGMPQENLDEIFKRIFQMLIGFYDSAIEDIFGENKGTLEHIRKKDEEINKFTLFLQRLIIKMSYPCPIHGKIMFAYSFALEKIGDEILRLWRTNIQENIKKDKKIRAFLLLSKKSLQEAFAIYYQSDSKKLIDLLEIRDKLRADSTKLINIDSSTTKFVMHSLRIMEEAYDLTHLTLMSKLIPE